MVAQNGKCQFRCGYNVSMHQTTAIRRAPFRKEESKMRSIPFILVALAFSAPAVAQSWEEYSYPEYAISVSFPASPKIEATTYPVVEGRSVPAHVYSVRQDKASSS
jgi:hypothetical protein